MTIRVFPGRRVISLATILAFSAGASAFGGARVQQQYGPVPKSVLRIEHSPVPCVTTVAGAAVDANVNPVPEVSSTRVLWRAAKQLPYYYYTQMTGTPPVFEGIIPRPEPATTAVEYRVEAIDRAALSRMTPEYVSPVLASSTCSAKGIVPGKKGLGLTIGLTDANQ